MKKHNVVTFGEIMLRLSTPGFSRFVQAHQFDISFGGGEANVAVSLALFGIEARFVTKLPSHDIGEAAVNELRRYGVNTDYIVRGGDRLGIYFLETGASQRSSKVIYDRTHSAVSLLKPGEIDWDAVFADADWFHWTGITMALGDDLQHVLKEACIAAKKKGVTVSVDPNYRKKLWSESQAKHALIPMMEYVDVCIANKDHAESILDVPSFANSDSSTMEDQYKSAEALKEKYQFTTVAYTLRQSYSASSNGWSAIMVDNRDCARSYHSKEYMLHIIDRVGGGDSFASGLIYGLLEKPSTQEALEFAVAASSLKHSIPGDFNHVSVEEVEYLLSSDGSGRLQR
jgi:2-dehydro-3-deoxygluconokinase